MTSDPAGSGADDAPAGGAPWDFAAPPAGVCYYCTADIPAGARTCPKCNRWRSRFRNALVFWSGFTGLVTLVASGLLFIYASWVTFYARQYGADLIFPNVSSIKDMSMLNNSSVDVVLGTVRFEFPGGKAISMIVDQPVASGGFVHLSLADLFRSQTVGGQEEYFDSRRMGSIVSLKGLAAKAGESAQEIAADLNHAIYEDYTVEAINRGGSDYRQFESQLDDMIQVPCRIEVDYQVVQGKRQTKTLDGCLGLVRTRKPETAGAASTPAQGP